MDDKLAEIKSQIKYHWEHLSVTTEEKACFDTLATYLSRNAGSSTFMAGRTLGWTTEFTRKKLKRMEWLGYVVGKSNGYNNINWKLA